MSLLEIWAFINRLLQSEPEVIAAFLVGVVCAIMGIFALRKWIFPRRDSEQELTRKDLEIARQDAELARREAQVVTLEEKIRDRQDLIEGMKEDRKRLQNALSAQEVVVTRLREEQERYRTSSAIAPSLATEYAAMQDRCVRLEAENGRFVLVKQSLEKDIRQLQADLAAVEAELAHSAKWLKVFDEEHSRLSSQESL